MLRMLCLLISILVACGFALLPACDMFPSVRAGDGPGIPQAPEAPAPPSTGTAQVDQEEAPVLTGFKYSAIGMAMSPYLSIRQTEKGYECAITAAEIYWPAIDAVDGYGFADYYDYLEFNEDRGYAYNPYSSFGDPLEDGGYPTYSYVLLTEDDMAEFRAIIEKHGMLAWDGFAEANRPTPGFEATDSGSRFDLKLLLSDGRVVHAWGIDAYPQGYGEAIADIEAFFFEHADEAYRAAMGE